MIQSETCQGNDTGEGAVKYLDDKNCERTDSGMDEGSNSLASGGAGDVSEDEEEEVLVFKPKKLTKRVLDEDSEDSQDGPGSRLMGIRGNVKKTAEEVLEAVFSASDKETESTTTPAGKRRHIKRPVADDSSSSEDENENVTLLSSLLVKKRDPKMSDIFDAEESAEDEATSGKANKNEKAMEEDLEHTEGNKESQVRKSIFSDEEQASSDSEKSSGVEDSGNDEEGDEGFDESALTPALLAKLKKGAAKKSPTARRQRAAKPSMMEIHGETQRIIRESRVSLPYHQPAPKSINDFLARANKKQQEYRILRGARDMTKAKVLQEVLQKTRIQSAPASQEDLDKFSDSDTEWTPETEKEQDQKEKVDKWLDKIGTDKDNKIDGNESAVVDGEGAEDTLPDLDVANKESGVETSKSESILLVSDLCRDEEVNLKVDQSKMEECGQEGKATSVVSVMECGKCVIEASHNKVMCRDHSDDRAIDGDCKVSENQENMDPKVNETHSDVHESEQPKTKMADEGKVIENDQKSVVQHKRSKLTALVEPELVNVTPKLNSGLDSFICLDEGEDKPSNPGVARLIDRLCQHSAKSEKKRGKDLDISVIQKDKTGIDKEELTLNTFTYHETEAKESPLMKLETPGAKLVALKEQLKEKMKARREEARQKRQDLYDLDNEEGGYEGEEEEEEMTDHSDTDVEDEDFEEQYGGEEEEVDEEKEENPFADDEAEEDEGDESDDDKDDDEEENEDEMKLKLDVSDEDDAESAEKESNLTKTPEAEKEDNETVNCDRDFKEPEEKTFEKPFGMFGSRTRENSVCSDTQLQSGQRSFRLTMPIEDSQDLCGNSMPDLTPALQPEESQSQGNFNFFLEDSQSQMLDAEGYLKVKSTGKKKPKMAGIDDLSSTQDNMDVLLGLCSGRFAGTQAEDKGKNSRKSLFDDATMKNTQANMEDFMGLCSGVFTDSKEDGVSQTQTSRKRRLSHSDDEDSNRSFECLSNVEAESDKENLSDSETVDKDDFINDDDEEEMDEDDECDEVDGDVETKKPAGFKGFTVKNKHGKIRKEFVEDEAELSGSEVDSDENLDLAEEDDIMMLEEGDKDTANMDEDQLRNEVGRVHLKRMIDEDKRELMRFQEMYLPDGDLHSEGAGRARRFRWNNIDDDTQQDMFDNDSDENAADEENENDFKWRKERYEREQWLKEQQEKENEEAENSQFLQLGKVFLKRKGSVEGSQTGTDKKQKGPGTPNSVFKLAKQKRGSFLARSKQDLEKIAGMTKPLANPSAGAKNSGNFVFQVISPDKAVEGNAVKPKQRTAHTPRQKKPPAKKPKLESQASFSQNSIFQHF